MQIQAKHIFLTAFSVAILGAGAFFLVNRKKKQAPEAGQTGNAIADTQINETPQNFISSVVDSSLQSVGLGAPRGIKNNNPLNIKWNALNNWQGQTGEDSGGFCIFDKPENGIRAAARNLRSYSAIGLSTIRQIVTRWTSGDSTKIQSNYINYVAGQLNISPDVPLNSNNYAALLSAMTFFENGQNPYPFSLFVSSVTSAGV